MTIPSAAPPVPHQGVLDALDDALVGLRRAQQRPGYRRQLLAGLAREVELATLRLLRVVQRQDGDPSIGKVAEVLVIDPSTASRVVDRAVSAGLLERRTCADDRRRSRLRLTDDGERVLDDVNRRRRELLAEVTASWDEADVKQLVTLLQSLVAELDALEGTQ